MNEASHPQTASADALLHPGLEQRRAEQNLMRKLNIRIVLFLFVLLVFSYLDRINIGFAGLTMGKDIGLTATQFGLATTLFYIAYIVFVLPSNVMLDIVGVRRWIATIMVAWGLASSATMFATGPTSLYVLRVLVGITEAGFLPGVLVYLTFWFPAEYRARANAWFLLAMPITTAGSSVVSGWILESMQGFQGLHGWQWMFVVEGIPAAILGIVVWFCLAEKPEDAKWLSAEERSLLARMLERDRAASMSTAQAAGTKKNWLQVFSPVILLFTLTYFFLTNTLSTVAVWGPQILKGIYQESDSLTIGMLNAIPQVVTIVAMILWGRSSDRMGERKVHAILAFLCAAAGWLIAAQGGHPALQLLGVCMASAGAFSGMALFWAVPHQSLDPRLLAVGIGFINAFGNIGGALNPVLMGYMRDASGDFRTGLYVVATFLVLGACLIAVLPFNKVRTPGTERASA